MKAGIVVDDWKLPIFRKRLTKAGFTYTDAGAFHTNTTVLQVETEEKHKARLSKIVRAAEAECQRSKREQ